MPAESDARTKSVTRIKYALARVGLDPDLPDFAFRVSATVGIVLSVLAFGNVATYQVPSKLIATAITLALLILTMFLTVGGAMHD